MTHARTFAAAFLALSITGYSGAQTFKCTTWNLQWFPNGSANDASAAQHDQRIREAANVLRPINPDVVLLQEVRDYAACARLGEAIAPMSLDRFCEITGLSKATVWRYRKLGWLRTHLIANRRYALAADVAEFNRRLAADEFAGTVHVPRRNRAKPQ